MSERLMQTFQPMLWDTAKGGPYATLMAWCMVLMNGFNLHVKCVCFGLQKRVLFVPRAMRKHRDIVFISFACLYFIQQQIILFYYTDTDQYYTDTDQ